MITSGVDSVGLSFFGLFDSICSNNFVNRNYLHLYFFLHNNTYTECHLNNTGLRKENVFIMFGLVLVLGNIGTI